MVSKHSLQRNLSDLFTTYSDQLNQIEEQNPILVNPQSNVVEIPKKKESEILIKSKEDKIEKPVLEEKIEKPVIEPEIEKPAAHPKDEKFYSYTMDEEERWGVADNFKFRRADEEDFWPLGASFDQKDVLNTVLRNEGYFDILEKVKMFIETDFEHFYDFLNLIFGDSKNLAEYFSTAEQINSIATSIFTEHLIWMINGSAHLRSSLLDIRCIEHPDFSKFFTGFSIPSKFRDAFDQQRKFRHDTLCPKLTRNLDKGNQLGDNECTQQSENKVKNEIENQKGDNHSIENNEIKNDWWTLKFNEPSENPDWSSCILPDIVPELTWQKIEEPACMEPVSEPKVQKNTKPIGRVRTGEKLSF